MNDGFEEILGKFGPKSQDLARRTKALIESVMPNVVQIAWPKQNVIGYGVGPKKMSEHFCYIGVFKNHVNLGFYYGSDLPDHHRLLGGTGKNFRNVKITEPDQLSNPALRELVTAASQYLPKLS